MLDFVRVEFIGSWSSNVFDALGAGFIESWTFQVLDFLRVEFFGE